MISQTGYPSVDKPWLKYYDSASEQGNLNISIYDFWHNFAKERYDDTVINYCGNKISNRIMDEKIIAVARSLSTIGVKSGDVISVCTINIPEVAYLLYGASVLGAVVDLFDPRTNEDGVKKYLSVSNSKYMFVLDDLINITQYTVGSAVQYIVHISPYESLAKGKKIIASVNRKKVYCKNKKAIFISWKEFIKNGYLKDIKRVTASNCKDEVVAIVHTGGTTGVPKGVKLTNGNFIAEYYNYKALDFDYKSGDVFLNILVPWVAYGMVFGFFVVYCLDFKTALIPVFSPEMITKLVLKYKPAQVLGIPAYYEQLLNDKRLIGKDLSFIKCLGSGGDSISIQKEELFNKFLQEHNSNSKFVKGYGMTELSSSVCTCTQSVNKLGSVGIPLINNTIAIFDSETYEEKKYGEIGEVCICSPTMMKGYDCEENNHTVMKQHADGKVWIHSGDVGYMDADGCLFIVDRIKRMIIRKGFKVYPSEIEKVVMKVSQIDSCVVVAKEHTDDVHTPFIFIVLKGENVDVFDEVFERLERELPGYEIPYETDIKIIKKIPHTKLGKVDYKKLETMV